MTKQTKEIYVSIDIESDGPIPGRNSMLSLGAAAFDLSAKNPLEPVDTFEINIERASGAIQDPQTMAWWATQPEAYEHVRTDPVMPSKAVAKFIMWTQDLVGKPTMVCYPTWDFMWVHWYIIRYGIGIRSPYGLGCLDIKTLAMVAMGKDHRKSTKRNMPKRWFKNTPKHDHTALQDAIGQGMLFVRIMKELA